LSNRDFVGDLGDIGQGHPSHFQYFID